MLNFIAKFLWRVNSTSSEIEREKYGKLLTFSLSKDVSHSECALSLPERHLVSRVSRHNHDIMVSVTAFNRTKVTVCGHGMYDFVIWSVLCYLVEVYSGGGGGGGTGVGGTGTSE